MRAGRHTMLGGLWWVSDAGTLLGSCRALTLPGAALSVKLRLASGATGVLPGWIWGQMWGRPCSELQWRYPAGGGLAFVGALALLCSALVACGQSTQRRKAGAAPDRKQQYEQLPTQEDLEVQGGSDGKQAACQEGGPAVVELTATTSNPV